tara:strand:+ start:1174 stop:1458 length:285 start_codon:yes stop_codon:yes gene_type:complete
MAHDGHPVEGWLSIEEDGITILHDTFYGATDLNIDLAAYGLHVKSRSILLNHVFDARILLSNHVANVFVVESVYMFYDRQGIGDVLWDTDLAHI